MDPRQMAYRKGYSTQTALISFLDDVRLAADRRRVTISVFFDFTKAFDNVDHRLLISKLRKLHFSNASLKWLRDYLHRRTQAVRDPVSGEISSKVTVTRGVPQGSVLGPLLFVLYLLDFGTVLKNCKYCFYADDLLIYLHADPSMLNNEIRKVNEDIVRVVEWAANNKLTLNARKTTSMILGTARYVNGFSYNNLVQIVVGCTAVPFSEAVVYLGVTISNTLSWEKQVTRTVSRVNAALYQLKLCGHLFPMSLRLRLVVALIFPILDYCCTVFTDISGELNLKLQRSLNACVRYIFKAKWDEHITPYFERLKWLKINARRRFLVGCLTFKIRQSMLPIDLYNVFVTRDSVSKRSTRMQGDNLALPLCRTELFKKSFRCYAAKLYNDIPSDIRTTTSFDLFKFKFFEHLLLNNN